MQRDLRPPSSTAPYRLAVAWRLLRARKINLISIVGVMLGLASIIVVMAVMDGFQSELKSMIRGTLSDLIVELDPVVVMDDAGYAEIRERVEGIADIEAVALQKHTFGVIPQRNLDVHGSAQNFLPVRVVGIVPEDERRVSSVVDSVVPVPGQPADPFTIASSDWLPQDTPRAVISEWLARRLGGGVAVGVGQVFNLITFKKMVDVEGRTSFDKIEHEVIVSRIYKSGNSEYDQLHLYVDLRRTGAEFFPSPEVTIAELRVRVRDYAVVDAQRASVAAALGPFDPAIARYPHVFIKTWEQRQSNLLKAVNNEKWLLGFVLFFIIVVACFTIFATLTMTVAEKTRDIGVLRALGATPRGIMSIFMLNGTLVGALGAGTGYAVGLFVAHNVNPIRHWLKDWFEVDIFPAEIYLFDEIPTHVDHQAALIFALSTLVCAFVFAVIPSFRASRLRPVEALRYE